MVAACGEGAFTLTASEDVARRVAGGASVAAPWSAPPARYHCPYAIGGVAIGRSQLSGTLSLGGSLLSVGTLGLSGSL